MEVVDLFPRSILKGELPTPLLKELLAMGTQVLKNPEGNPDASLKLAGQLTQQRELKPGQPGVQSLIGGHLLPWMRALDPPCHRPSATPRSWTMGCWELPAKAH
jgi:hypothetical protein